MSFRQGTNVEFEGPSFVEGGGAPAVDNRDFSNPMYDMNGQQQQSAVLAPSSVSHIEPSPPGTRDPIRPRELSPVSIDTGKDTQCLVEDDSEC